MNGKGKLSKSFFLPCEELGQIMLEVCKSVTTHLRLVYVEALHDLLPSVQFRKREKHPLRSVT